MKIFIPLFFCFLTVNLTAQTTVGIQTQAYPAGIIPGLLIDYGIERNSSLHFRVGYNFTDRRDWGEHEDEEGGGPGFSIGYEYQNIFVDNLSASLRADFWFMEIDWTDPPYPAMMCGPLPCPDRTGTTSIVVLQPTIGLGYQVNFARQLFIKPAVSFGREINVKTDGEEVGEGFILLGGVLFGYQF